MTGTTTSTGSERLLRRTLVGNAAFSAVSGVGLVVLAGLLAGLIGVSAGLLVVVGLGLLPFAYLVFRVARTEPLSSRSIWPVVAADALWIIGAVVIIAIPDTMTPEGKLLLALASAAVAAFGATQTVGLRRLASSS